MVASKRIFGEKSTKCGLLTEHSQKQCPRYNLRSVKFSSAVTVVHNLPWSALGEVNKLSGPWF